MTFCWDFFIRWIRKPFTASLLLNKHIKYLNVVKFKKILRRKQFLDQSIPWAESLKFIDNFSKDISTHNFNFLSRWGENFHHFIQNNFSLLQHNSFLLIMKSQRFLQYISNRPIGEQFYEFVKIAGHYCCSLNEGKGTLVLLPR